MKLRTIALVTAAATILSGCVTPPMGPTIAATPGPNRPWAAYQEDEQVCENYASQSVGGQADEANNRAVGSALIGTALGAGLGAAVGGGRGAAVGAASGAVVGTAVGSNQSAHAQYSLQQRYNIAYGECMTAHGDSVQWGPGYPYPPYGPPRGYPPPPPPGAYPPPPPPGY